MEIELYTKAPAFWTIKELLMSPKEREQVGIKLVKINIEYNIDTSAQHPTIQGDDIVRYFLETKRVKNKES